MVSPKSVVPGRKSQSAKTKVLLPASEHNANLPKFLTESPSLCSKNVKDVRGQVFGYMVANLDFFLLPSVGLLIHHSFLNHTSLENFNTGEL